MNTAMSEDVIGLAEEGAVDPAISGRKAATLAALAAGGPSGAARLRGHDGGVSAFSRRSTMTRRTVAGMSFTEATRAIERLFKA
jgi:hypothetical protein